MCQNEERNDTIFDLMAIAREEKIPTANPDIRKQ